MIKADDIDSDEEGGAPEKGAKHSHMIKNKKKNKKKEQAVDEDANATEAD